MKGRLLPFLLFAPVILGISALLAWRLSPGLLTGAEFLDPDGYMRLLRVRRLAEGGGWFDGTVPRSNWPLGETLHWTRPLDVLLLAGGGLLAPVVGFARGLHLTGVFLGPLLLVVTFAATAWAAEPVAGREGRGFAMLVLLAQPTVMTFALPGRPDHHALILVCFAVALGFQLRGLVTPSSWRWAVGAGVASGVGLWVSPEFLLPLALFLGMGVWSWVRHGGSERVRFNLRWTGAWAVTTAGALLVERGPGVLAVEYDRLSVVHMLVAVLAVGVWGTVRVWGSRGGAAGAARDRPAGRWALAGLAAAGALGILAWAFPPFFRGPMVEVTDPLARAWLRLVEELQPALLPTTLRGAGLLLANAGSALVSLVALAWLWREHREDKAHEGRLLLAIGMAACLALALLQVRWIIYVQVMAAPALAWAVVRVRARRWPEDPRRLGPLVARAATSAGLVAGPLVLGAAVYSLGGPVSPAAATVRAGCDHEAVASHLATGEMGREPLTVAAYMNLGPVILYRTHHRVLATPYHRNQRGLRVVHELLTSVDEEQARARARAAQVDVIVLCPSWDGILFPRQADGRATLYGRLLEGDLPTWVEEKALPPSLAGARLYRVRSAAATGNTG